ncbi:LysR family transcriptional regulator [Nocardiopsis sp. TSRI0078]|uniref:LysR family transcriptional regulator n=1 Tax=unclassified Nocardiopsis TaxID=2649073 RepID=UPI00093EEAEC|nr:LysR family transcriptional regulator [Nocardiopsis sp. TSRI0078]OKI21070.1 LysR family transcriptional regulator [Nocardiopsis sp. TSRI0078]
MRGIEIRELECFLVLAEELHLGHAGERLGVSADTVDQLVRSLEDRVGAPLLDPASRRCGLTRFGEEFLDNLRPAYQNLAAVVDGARERARGGPLRVRLGFQGTVHGPVAEAVRTFEEREPGARVEIMEIKLSDVFGPLREGEVDAAVVLLPVRERDLVVGAVFSRQPQRLALPEDHPLASRSVIGVEDMARVPLIPVRRAPDYWLRVHSPTVTPLGRTIHHEQAVDTLREGLSQVAAGRGAMLLCGDTADHGDRDGVVLVPVSGLPESSLGLVWPRGDRNPGVPVLAAALTEALA